MLRGVGYKDFRDEVKYSKKRTRADALLYPGVGYWAPFDDRKNGPRGNELFKRHLGYKSLIKVHNKVYTKFNR